MATFTDQRKLEMYRFFLVAFDAAPGATYLGQLQQAVEAGLSTQEIVNVFTTKSQFLAEYPSSLLNSEFASKLVNRVIGDAASTEAKAKAVSDITAALWGGMSRGDVIFTVFGNLASRELDPSKAGYNPADPYLGVAKQLANMVKVASYYSETLKRSTTELSVLQDAVARVNSFSDVSTAQSMERLIAGFDAARQLDMYRFFLVAFDAAPGQTYWGQLKSAVESGLSTRDIVNIFTSKAAFQAVYPDSLSNQVFAQR